MNDIVLEFQKLCESDLSTLSTAEKLTFYQSTIKDLDNLLTSKNISLDNYEILIHLKRKLMIKSRLLENE